jgi:hypothetical protein
MTLQIVAVPHASQTLEGDGAENLDIWTEPLSEVQCSRIVCEFEIVLCKNINYISFNAQSIKYCESQVISVRITCLKTMRKLA